MTNKYEFTGDLILPVTHNDGYEYDLACRILWKLFPSFLELLDQVSEDGLLASTFTTVETGTDSETVLKLILDKLQPYQADKMDNYSIKEI